MPKNNELYEERRVNGARLFLTRTTQKQRRRYVPISICTFDFVSPPRYIFVQFAAYTSSSMYSPVVIVDNIINQPTPHDL